MPTRRLPALLLTAALVASCTGNAAPVTTPENRLRTTGGGTKARATAKPVTGTPPAGGTTPAGNPDDPAPPKAVYFGRVVGVDGKSAAFVKVRAYQLDAAGTGVISVARTAGAYALRQAATPLETTTKADGSFVFDVPAGTRLVVEAEQAQDVKAIATFVAKADANVELRLAKTGTVQGKVTASGAPGVKDFANAEVGIPGTPYTAKADAAGVFRFDNVPVGDYNVHATRDDLGDGKFGPVAVTSAQTAQITVDIGVITPVITALEPAVAGPGAAVKVIGTGFANSRGTAFGVTLAGVALETAARTDNTTLSFVLPSGAANGDVVVTVGAVASAPFKLQVIKSLSIQANPKELAAGASHAFVATAVDSAGQPVASVPAIWTASGTAFADASGLVTAGATLGDAIVQATSGTLTDTLTVKVIQAPAAAVPSPTTP